MKRFLLIVLLFFLSRHVPASDIDLEAVRRAIEARGAKWRAGETSVSNLSKEERKGLYGLVLEEDNAFDRDRDKKLLKSLAGEKLPRRFSWADNNGDFITPVRDQNPCGSCSYFATLAAAESWLRIKSGDPDLDVDLSEQFVLSCGGVGDCENGASIERVHQYLMTFGVPDEECFPYRANDNVPCSERCADYNERLYRIGDFVVSSQYRTSIEEIKNAVYHHPAAAGMQIFKDFMTYTGGVYEHVEGDFEGLHAVLIYGWDDTEQAWLCKNSWGTGWGADGHFRIKYGEANLGTPVVLIWDFAGGSPKISYDPGAINLQLSPGEKTVRYLTVKNEGTGRLEYDIDITCDYMPDSGVENEFEMWTSVPFGTGSLAAGDSVNLPLTVSASYAALGQYNAVVQIQSNDYRHTSANMSIKLVVDRSEQDVAISAVDEPSFNWPRFLTFEPAVRLKNWGISGTNDIELSCEIFDSTGALLYDEKTILTGIAPNDSVIGILPPVALHDLGGYRSIFRLHMPGGDDNVTNNEYTMWFRVIKTIDDFEQASDLWDFGTGWGVTENYGGGYESDFAMHVNSGEYYIDGMDNNLTLKRSFDFSNTDAASLSFWIRYAMGKDSDFLLVQASTEEDTAWTTLESLTGVKLGWHKRQISLHPYVGPDKNRVKIRFRFISDDLGTNIGPMIDDLAILSEPVLETENRTPEQLPDQVRLFQNYPNPFNPETRISYSIPKPAYVTIRIINLQGQVVDVLVESQQTPAVHRTVWRPDDLASGVYFYHMTAESENGEQHTATKKLLYIK